MNLTSAKRRDKWGWLPVLFLRTKGRTEALPDEDKAETLGTEGQAFLRLVAQMLPRCVPDGSGERRELIEISDRLEVLAGGIPEHEWAEALSDELRERRGGAAAPSIRVSWG